jgi:hypothetical protein
MAATTPAGLRIGGAALPFIQRTPTPLSDGVASWAPDVTACVPACAWTAVH